MESLRWPLLVASFAAIVFGSFTVHTSGAIAHERRTVGAVNFVVGWLNEPALLNQPNSVDLRISKAADASAITGAEKTLKVEIAQGEQKLSLDISPRFNASGAYNAYLTPTKAGVYSFKFTGTIDGANVNETFTSSATTFGSVEEPRAFPADLPSNQSLEERVVALEAAPEGGDSSDSAMIAAIVGIILGAAGLAVGGFALTKKSA